MKILIHKYRFEKKEVEGWKMKMFFQKKQESGDLSSNW